MSYRSTPAFAVGGIAPEFRCLICGVEVGTYGRNAPRGICEEHCEDHDYEYCSDVRESLCIHCDAPAPDDYYQCDDDVGFGSYASAIPDGPIGVPASSMNGNAAARHDNPAAWDNWVAFCHANGHP